MEMHMFCIILADRPNGSRKRTFLKPGLTVKKFKKVAPLDSESAYFAYRWRHRPIPRPLAFNLLTPLCLITTTTTTTPMAEYMLAFVLQKVLSLLGLLGQNIILLCHYAEQNRRMDNHIRHIVFWWISSTTYRPGIWTTACWVIYNGSIWMQIFLKWCQGRKDCFGTCGHCLRRAEHYDSESLTTAGVKSRKI